jgi:hypothetical protein
MHRLAIFVEGYTELVFVDKLLNEVAGSKNIIIEKRKIRGGSTVQRTMRQICATKQETDQKFYIQIFDCGGDDLVKNRILEEHENLTKKGYVKLIGLRDVRPQFSHAEIPRLEQGLRYKIKTNLAPVSFILSVLEIENWFLSEHTHFHLIEPSITVDAIKAQLGFDPENDDMSQRLTPADDMNDCYQIGGEEYRKDNSSRTAKKLDYAQVYFNLRGKIPYLDRLLSDIDEFLDLETT